MVCIETDTLFSFVEFWSGCLEVDHRRPIGDIRNFRRSVLVHVVHTRQLSHADDSLLSMFPILSRVALEALARERGLLINLAGGFSDQGTRPLFISEFDVRQILIYLCEKYERNFPRKNDSIIVGPGRYVGFQRQDFLLPLDDIDLSFEDE